MSQQVNKSTGIDSKNNIKGIRYFSLFTFHLILALTISSCGGGSTKSGSQKADTIALASCPKFSAENAMLSIEEQCAFGPRTTDSQASRECADYIVARFREYGASVEVQTEKVKTWDGTEMTARNIVASINPQNKDRILFCSHWDSRPWADNDPDEANHHTPVLAANDGASGVAVMMELCRLLQQQPVETGIDFVCFDAEDMGTPQWADEPESDRSTWCLGSEAWAQRAAGNGYKARFGVLMDMVGGRGCSFAKERVSVYYASPIVDMIWHLAAQIGYGQYFPISEGGALTDDHVNVNQITRIPCLDIVPYFTDGPSVFGPTWHTVNDTPENIDPNVLEAVGQTLTQLIYNDNAKL